MLSTTIGRATLAGNNCAERVYMYYKDRLHLSDEGFKKMKACGHGKAPTGRCGALYSVLQFIDDPVKKEQLETEFAARSSSPFCKKIRRLDKLSCLDCVATAVELGDKYIDK